MESRVCSLGDLISGDVQYLVPPYQRQYVWGKQQWEQLWNDVRDHYFSVLDAQKKGKKIDYYLGPIILMQNTQNDLPFPQWHIVDGQQRLITMMIFFSVMKYFALHEKHDPELTQKIDNSLFLTNNQGKALRFIPSKKDVGIYGDTLSFERKQDISDSHIARAYRTFKIWLSNDEDIKSDLHQFYDVITHNLDLVVINLNRSENPYLVFESVNSKGEDLTESDLVKNLFFSKYPSSVEADKMYSTYWEPMEERFNRDSDELSSFLRHYYMKNGEIIEKRKIFSTIRELFENLSEREIRDITKNLNRFSTYYQMILTPEQYLEKKPKNIIKHLIRINNLNTESPYPFLLHCLDQNEDLPGRGKILSDEEFERILETIESYLVRRYVCQKKTNVLPKVFSELCPKRGMERVPINAYELTQKINEIPKADPPANGEFFEYLINEDIYRKGSAMSGIKVILAGLEDTLRKKFYSEFPDVSQDEWPDLNATFSSDLNLDLIMPEDLSSDWKHQLGEEFQKIHGENYKKLGNITITLKKSVLSGTNSFKDKKPVYRGEQFLLDTSLLDESSWQDEEIRERTLSLAQLAVETWPWRGKIDGQKYLDGELPDSPPTAIIVKQRKYPVKYWYQVAERTIDAITELNGGDVSVIHLILENGLEGHDTSQSSLLRRFSQDSNKFRYKIGDPPQYSFNSKNLGRYEARNISRLIIEEMGWDWSNAWALVFDKVVER